MMTVLHKKSAFLFQGVGPEYQQFLDLLSDADKVLLKHYCNLANESIGLDLFGYLFGNIETQYEKMFNDWIAIYTCDYIVYQHYEKLGIKPSLFLGYSMGLITAMVCGQALSYTDGLKMLLTIYEYPIIAKRRDEGMAVIVGMTYEQVEYIISENALEKSVEIASENNIYCIIISGEKTSVNKVMSLAEAEGALKVRDINAPYAFHSKHALKGIERYEMLVESMTISNSKIPIVSSFDQRIMRNFEDLKKELIRNMSGRMYWKTSIETAVHMGIEAFVEVSLADYVTKYSKVIDRQCDFITYKKLIKRHSKDLVIA